MSYEAAMARLARAAMFPKAPGLCGMRALLDALGSPERGLRIVHIAGTNGKGSTAALLRAALTAAGYRAGLFCSPYVERFCERVQVDGSPIPEAEVGRILARVDAAAGRLTREATFFELVTALGLCHFAEAGCDVVALEVGLGGLFDPTNAIPSPDVAVIAKLGLDHTAVLGNTLEAIAAQKAGILKPGCDAVLLAQGPAVEAVVRARAQAVGARLFLASPPPFRMEGAHARLRLPEGEVRLGLAGRFQAENAGLALAALARLQARGFAIPHAAVAAGFSNLAWPGRFAILRERPPFVLDGAHNPPAMRALCESLAEAWPAAMQGRRAVFLVGMMQDKDYDACLAILAPYARAMVAIAPEEPRALPPAALAQAMRRQGAPAFAAPTPEAGLTRALALTPPDGLTVACGSLHLCGRLRAAFAAGAGQAATPPSQAFL